MCVGGGEVRVRETVGEGAGLDGKNFNQIKTIFIIHQKKKKKKKKKNENEW